MSSMNKDVFFSLAHYQYQNYHVIRVCCLEELKFIFCNHSKKENDLAKIVNYMEYVSSFQSHIKALKINLSKNHLPEQFLTSIC